MLLTSKTPKADPFIYIVWGTLSIVALCFFWSSSNNKVSSLQNWMLYRPCDAIKISKLKFMVTQRAGVLSQKRRAAKLFDWPHHTHKPLALYKILCTYKMLFCSGEPQSNTLARIFTTRFDRDELGNLL